MVLVSLLLYRESWASMRQLDREWEWVVTSQLAYQY
jgi:hypothetical protein